MNDPKNFAVIEMHKCMEFNLLQVPSLPIRNLLGEIVMIWTQHNGGYDFLYHWKTSNFLA